MILTFLKLDDGDWTGQLTTRVGVLLGGLLLLLIFAKSRYAEQIMWRVNNCGLRRFGGIHLNDYTRLPRIVQNYVVSELQVRHGDWLADPTLQQLRLANDGVLVLGVETLHGDHLDAPRRHTRLEAEDGRILYGQHESLLDLKERHAGMEDNVKHVMAVTEEEMNIESAL